MTMHTQHTAPSYHFMQLQVWPLLHRKRMRHGIAADAELPLSLHFCSN